MDAITQVTWRTKRVRAFCTMLLWCGAANAQTVTPWLTKGDQGALLEMQDPSSLIPYLGGGTTVVVDSTTSHQSVDGFGFCLTQGSAEVINGLEPETKANLLNDLFGAEGLGISMLRISLGASDLSNSVYTYNESPDDVDMINFSLEGPDLDHLIPLIHEILAINPSIKLMASPWTAPIWMKTNNDWIGGSLNPQYYAAYSQYFLRYLEEMENQGIDIWAITPQNEPENQWNQPSMLMSAPEQIAFINNHLGPELASSGFETKIIAFDHNCDNTAYPISVLNASPYVDGAAFHMYAGSISALTTVKEATGKNVYFTEQYTDVNGDFNGDMGWHMENVLIGSLNNWSKCVLEWNLATDSSYGPHTQFGCSDCLGALTIQSETQYDTNVSYYIVGHASKFIQPDAVRINVTTSSSKLLVTGFKNPDNTLAILAYNYWGGLDDAEDIELVIDSQKMDFTIPPRSTVTFAVSNSDEAFVQEAYQNQARELVKIIDLTGRETGFKPNCPLIYMYSDGTHQRVMKSDW